MKKKHLNQIKRKEAQALARNMNKVYQGFLSGQMKLPFWKRQRLALKIAYGIPFKYKILRISSAFGTAVGKLHKLRKGKSDAEQKTGSDGQSAKPPPVASAASEV